MRSPSRTPPKSTTRASILKARNIKKIVKYLEKIDQLDEADFYGICMKYHIDTDDDSLIGELIGRGWMYYYESCCYIKDNI